MRNIVLIMGLFMASVIAVFAQSATLPRLAVVSFTTDINNERAMTDAIAIRQLAESRMVATGRYRIIAVNEIDRLLENQSLQVSLISSAENIRKLRLENISYIVTGSLDVIGNDYEVNVRVLDISTGHYLHSDSELMGSTSRELYNGITGLMARFVAGMTFDESGRIVQSAGRPAPDPER